MFGWVILGAGLLTFLQEWLYLPHSMEKVRDSMVQRGDTRKFDAFLASRKYQFFRLGGLIAGTIMVIFGVLILTGVI